eukprot:Nk52_evm19s2377 gene=Nk52_evmTU19s2377
MPPATNSAVQVGPPILATEEQIQQPSDIVHSSLSEPALDFLSQVETDLQQHGLSLSGLKASFLAGRNSDLETEIEHDRSAGEDSGAHIPKKQASFEELLYRLKFSSERFQNEHSAREYNISMYIESAQDVVFDNGVRSSFENREHGAWSSPLVSRAVPSKEFDSIAYRWEYPEENYPKKDSLGNVQLYSFASNMRLLSMRADIEENGSEEGAKKLVIAAEMLFPPKMSVDYYYDSKEEIPYAKESFVSDRQSPEWMVVKAKVTLPLFSNDIVKVFYRKAHDLRFRHITGALGGHIFPYFEFLRFADANVNDQKGLDTVYFGEKNEEVPEHVPKKYKQLDALKEYFKSLHKCLDESGRSILAPPKKALLEDTGSFFRAYQQMLEKHREEIQRTGETFDREVALGHRCRVAESEKKKLRKILVREETFVTWDIGFDFPEDSYKDLEWQGNNQVLFRKGAEQEIEESSFDKPLEIEYANEEVKEYLVAAEASLNRKGLSYSHLDISLKEEHHTNVETTIDCNEQDLANIFQRDEQPSSLAARRVERGFRDVQNGQGAIFSDTFNSQMGIRIDLTPQRGGTLELRDGFHKEKRRRLAPEVSLEALKKQNINVPVALSGKNYEKAVFLGVHRAKFELKENKSYLLNKDKSDKCALLILRLAYYRSPHDREYLLTKRESKVGLYASVSSNEDNIPTLYYKDVTIAIPPAGHLVKVKEASFSMDKRTEVKYNQLLNENIYNISRNVFELKRESVRVSMEMGNSRTGKLLFHTFPQQGHLIESLSPSSVAVEDANLVEDKDEEFITLYNDVAALNPDNNVIAANLITSLNMHVNMKYNYAPEDM